MNFKDPTFFAVALLLSAILLTPSHAAPSKTRDGKLLPIVIYQNGQQPDNQNGNGDNGDNGDGGDNGNGDADGLIRGLFPMNLNGNEGGLFGLQNLNPFNWLGMLNPFGMANNDNVIQNLIDQLLNNIPQNNNNGDLDDVGVYVVTPLGVKRLPLNNNNNNGDVDPDDIALGRTEPHGFSSQAADYFKYLQLQQLLQRANTNQNLNSFYPQVNGFVNPQPYSVYNNMHGFSRPQQAYGVPTQNLYQNQYARPFLNNIQAPVNQPQPFYVPLIIRTAPPEKNPSDTADEQDDDSNTNNSQENQDDTNSNQDGQEEEDDDSQQNMASETRTNSRFSLKFDDSPQLGGQVSRTPAPSGRTHPFVRRYDYATFQ